MKTRLVLFPYLAMLSLLPPATASTCSASGAGDILTGQYDSYRTGANLSETILTHQRFRGEQFRLLFSIFVSSSAIYAQPLIVHNLTIGGHAYCTVVFVAGVDNSIYAFDGDNPPTAAAPYIWKTPAFGAPVSYTTSKYSGFLSSGILSAR